MGVRTIYDLISIYDWRLKDDKRDRTSRQCHPNPPSIPPAPIHPLAALTTIVLDNVFGVFELVDPLALILTSVTRRCYWAR